MLAATQRTKLSARLNRCAQSARHYQYFGDGTMRHQRQDSTWDKIVKIVQPPVQPGTLILVRHGESEWNNKRLFTGWVDTDLTDRGIREIEHASRLLLERGYTVDITYTSLLKRAVRSSWIMLNEINQIYTPVVKTWRLNERMYGALEGHSKPGLANLYGGEVVQKWRAGLSDRPPPMSPDHPYWHGFERKYANLSAEIMPLSESLQDTIDRTVPLWETNIVPDLKAGRNVMIMAHRNSIKGILKHIDGISTDDLMQVGVPNGIPLVYKFDRNIKPIKHKNAGYPLSGIWLGKKGLLRAALDQEAELAHQIEGYNYTRKYNTNEFYYHAPSMYNTRYTIRDPVLDANPATSTTTTTTTTSTTTLTSAGGTSVDTTNTTSNDNTHAPTNATNTSNSLQPDEIENSYIYGGTDANLIRKLILLDQERKLFDLVDTTSIANVKENVDEANVNNPDIYLDPRVILTPAVPVPDFSPILCNTTGSHVDVDIARLNQIKYFTNTCSETIANLAIDDATPAEYNNNTCLAKPLSTRTNAILNPILSRPLLVIIRHGKTEHNKLGLFTGWEDAALSPEGRKEARTAGKLLKKHGFKFDVVYTSWLSRAIETAWLVLNELDSLWVPIIKTWRLNERMYGALTGLSKKMIRQIYGDDQFKKWRRGYNEPPPEISSFSSSYPGNDLRYVKYVSDMPISLFESAIRSLAHGQVELHRKLPKSESLKDCMERTIPFFMNEIKPDSIDKDKNVLIASSENAIRGLLMHLCNIPESRINAIEIPTGIPLIYDRNLGKLRLLQEVSPEGIVSGSALLEKYSFGDSPELLFDLTQVDVPLVSSVGSVSVGSIGDVGSVGGKVGESGKVGVSDVVGGVEGVKSDRVEML